MKRFYHQLIIIILLIIFPLMMIYYNGKRTFESITWGMQYDTSITGQDSLASSDPATPSIENRRPQELFFGVYDPNDVFQSWEAIDIQQLYISWVEYDEERLIKDLQAIKSKGDIPLITIEPWPHEEAEEDLMRAIVNGKYDNEIENLCSVFEPIQSKMFLSWGHEMDQDLTVRYPWSGVSPQDYIKAYHYVVDKISGCSVSIKWFWSPVGKESTRDYWPGEDYVDYIGLPVYSFPQWDSQVYQYIRSFTESFGEKYELMTQYEKPIVITEFGVTGSSDFQSYWLHQAFTSFADYPLLRGVIFFYSTDTENAWGNNLPTPDWRSDATTIRSLVEWYQEESLSE